MIRYETRSWLQIVLSVRGTVVPRVAARTLICVAVAAVGLVLRERGLVDLSIPVVVHTITGVALGLLLVFRTNASYDRYWEGRKLVEGVVDRCRDLARQTRSFVSHEEARVRAGAYVVALYTAVRRHLRSESDFEELRDLLRDDEIQRLGQASAPPLEVSRWLTDLYVGEADAGRLSEHRLRSIEGNIGALVDLWGGAERILETPVPFAYAHHIKLFLTFFCFTVPLALIDGLGWLATVGAGIVAFGMFGIDEIGVEIEDPFGYDDNDLPLDEIGRKLRREIMQTVSAPT
ncbi:MAG: bestrophin family ion channel [Myxococcota bacterium]